MRGREGWDAVAAAANAPFASLFAIPVPAAVGRCKKQRGTDACGSNVKGGDASEEQAMAAAEEVAVHKRCSGAFRTGMVKRFCWMEERLDGVDARFAMVEGQLKLHTWLLTINTALLIAILLRVFWP